MVAQQLGLGFVTAVDPTQNQQGCWSAISSRVLGITLIFATDLHHLVIAALNDSYTIFQPGELPLIGDCAQHVTHIIATAFRIGIQLSAPFLVFGLLFNLGLGVLSRLMPQMQVFFIGLPLSILLGLLLLLLVIGAMMGTFVGYLEGVLGRTCAAQLSRGLHGRRTGDTDKTEDPTQKRLDEALKRGDVVKSQEVNTWFVIAGATLVLMAFSGSMGKSSDHDHARADRQFPRHQRRRAGAARLFQKFGSEMIAAHGDSVPAADAGGARRQHDPASSGLVASRRSRRSSRRSRPRPAPSGCSPSRRSPISPRASSSSCWSAAC